MAYKCLDESERKFAVEERNQRGKIRSCECTEKRREEDGPVLSKSLAALSG